MVQTLPWLAVAAFKTQASWAQSQGPQHEATGFLRFTDNALTRQIEQMGCRRAWVLSASGASVAGKWPAGRRRLPGGGSVFPLVIGELFDASAIVPHDKQFSIRLRGVGVNDFIFEAHSGTGERDELSVRRPCHVRVIAVSKGKALEACPIGLDRVDLVRAINQARERDQAAAGRPQREIIV